MEQTPVEKDKIYYFVNKGKISKVNDLIICRLEVKYVGYAQQNDHQRKTRSILNTIFIHTTMIIKKW